MIKYEIDFSDELEFFKNKQDLIKVMPEFKKISTTNEEEIINFLKSVENKNCWADQFLVFVKDYSQVDDYGCTEILDMVNGEEFLEDYEEG